MNVTPVRNPFCQGRRVMKILKRFLWKKGSPKTHFLQVPPIPSKVITLELEVGDVIEIFIHLGVGIGDLTTLCLVIMIISLQGFHLHLPCHFLEGISISLRITNPHMVTHIQTPFSTMSKVPIHF